jgi:6-phosphogluconolactonase (cycloisomerase 2 family)
MLYAANEKSGSIHHLTVDEATGTLGDATAVAQVGSPVCIVFSTDSCSSLGRCDQRGVI